MKAHALPMRQARQTEATMSNAETGTREVQIVIEDVLLRCTKSQIRWLTSMSQFPLEQINSKRAVSSVSYSFKYDAWKRNQCGWISTGTNLSTV